MPGLWQAESCMCTTVPCGFSCGGGIRCILTRQVSVGWGSSSMAGRRASRENEIEKSKSPPLPRLHSASSSNEAAAA